MKFKGLTQEDKDLIVKSYQKSKENRKDVQNELADYFDVSPRTIRKWASKLQVGVMKKNILNAAKIMIYDIETSRVPAWVFWSGKQYIHSDQLAEEPRIISISWKWLGEDEVHDLTWDKYHSDKKMVEIFVKEYNKAHMVIGQNNDRFDNRWVNARAAKYNIDINVHVRSFDIMKQAKTKFRIPSYSMKYMCKYFGVPQKLEHEGIKMWDKIQTGTLEEQTEYLAKMVTYNHGDIISTEALYLRLRKYFNHRAHFGVFFGGEKFTCPDTGSYNVELERTTVTPAGTIQRVMVSGETGTRFKISNKQYMNFLDWKMKNSKDE